MTIHRFTYAVILTDSFSKYRWVILVKKKSKIPKKLELKFRQIQQRWKFNTFIFHSDERTEFTNNSLKQYFKQSGISHHTSNVGTPQQNGLAEVTNKIVFNGVRAMLHTTKLFHNFWDYALTYHLKQLKSYPMKHPLEQNTMITPHELLTEFKPDITMFRIFGTKGFSKRPLTKRFKLDSKAEPCQFLGITKKPSFIVRWLKDTVLGETRTAKFNEQEIVSDKFDNTAKIAQQVIHHESKSCFQAINHPEKIKWMEAYQTEIDSLERIGKFQVVQRPSDKSSKYYLSENSSSVNTTISPT
eukprot:snap_masked-scaffold_24-processed-gene-5.42-mRNA-1 protein AED:1.00 eAED:1.00 QI:0/-1/0/0/-1/1/1/0/299